MSYLPPPFDQHEWPENLQTSELKDVSTDFASFITTIGIAKALSVITRIGRYIALVIPLRSDCGIPQDDGRRGWAHLPSPFDEEVWPESFHTVDLDEAAKNPYGTILELSLRNEIGIVARRDDFGAMIIPLQPGSDGRIITRGLECGSYTLVEDDSPGVPLDDLLRELDEEDGLAEQIEGLSQLDIELDELLRKERDN